MNIRYILCILFSLLGSYCLSALIIRENNGVNSMISLIGGFAPQDVTIGDQQGATTVAVKVKKSKRKRVKAKMKKWISVFTKLDHKNNTVLTYYGMMFAGAIARSASATAVHPLNVIKTLLQTKNGKMPEFTWKTLSRGAGSQFIMSIPHGALNYAVTETTKLELAKLSIDLDMSSVVPKKLLDPILDFVSSAVSTFICSIVSTPQMVLTDRIMAGRYDNLPSAVFNIAKKEGFLGFYRGWLPALVQKIPSYALTWMFFQQVKAAFTFFMTRPGTTLENTLLGSFAAAGACCVMIPVDTIKTRMVMQPPGENIYDGMIDCFHKIMKEEGGHAFYKALPPRLFAVVPMIGIQFSVYELIKRLLLKQPAAKIVQNSQSNTGATGSGAAAPVHPLIPTVLPRPTSSTPSSSSEKQQPSNNVPPPANEEPLVQNGPDLAMFDVLNPTITTTDFESISAEENCVDDESEDETAATDDNSSTVKQDDPK